MVGINNLAKFHADDEATFTLIQKAMTEVTELGMISIVNCVIDSFTQIKVRIDLKPSTSGIFLFDPNSISIPKTVDDRYSTDWC